MPCHLITHVRICGGDPRGARECRATLLCPPRATAGLPRVVLSTSLKYVLTRRLCATGSNLSQGQRQLVSLARAMLTPSNILVLDEATAAVDVETDAMLQNTLRSELFSHRTIITVAHRINTILDSDRIVVLDKGEVVEFDTPQALLKQKGIFYGLVKQSGLDTE